MSYKQINFEEENPPNDEKKVEDTTEKNNEGEETAKTEENNEEIESIRMENKRIMNVAISFIAICSAIIAGTIVSTIAFL